MNSTFRAGAAEVVITPPVGTSLMGYSHDRVAERVRDELFAKALVVEQDSECMALVSCDLCVLPKEIAQQAAAQVEQQTGIPASRVLIAATHTHTGPATTTDEPEEISPAPEEWMAALPGKIVEAIAEAFARRRPAEMRIGCGQEMQLSFNRLMRLTDGRQIFGFGTGTDDSGSGAAAGKVDVVGPADTIDPEVVVARIVDREGNTIAFMVNYALHVDVIGGAPGDFISADWPGELSQALKAIYGADTVTLFLNGAAGDLNHIDYLELSGAIQGLGRVEKAVQIGRAIAGIAMNVGEKAPAVHTEPLSGVLEEISVPYCTREEVRSAVKELLSNPELKEEERQFVQDQANQEGLWGQQAALPIQALRIGDLAVTGVPCEYFVSWGLDIKDWSPAPFTMVVELANGWFGYVPTWQAINRGGYGAAAVWCRRLGAEAGQRIADQIFVQLQRLWD